MDTLVLVYREYILQDVGKKHMEDKCCFPPNHSGTHDNLK